MCFRLDPTENLRSFEKYPTLPWTGAPVGGPRQLVVDILCVDLITHTNTFTHTQAHIYPHTITHTLSLSLSHTHTHAHTHTHTHIKQVLPFVDRDNMLQAVFPSAYFAILFPVLFMVVSGVWEGESRHVWMRHFILTHMNITCYSCEWKCHLSPRAFLGRLRCVGGRVTNKSRMNTGLVYIYIWYMYICVSMKWRIDSWLISDSPSRVTARSRMETLSRHEWIRSCHDESWVMGHDSWRACRFFRDSFVTLPPETWTNHEWICHHVTNEYVISWQVISWRVMGHDSWLACSHHHVTNEYVISWRVMDHELSFRDESWVMTHDSHVGIWVSMPVVVVSCVRGVWL